MNNPSLPFLPSRIISGAQTGVDRAALDAALAAVIPCGGVAPKGRKAEDGRIPDRYPVEECDAEDYTVRTELNVARSDATLILNTGALDGGTLMTRRCCEKHRKPFCVVQLDGMTRQQAVERVLEFLRETNPKTLNVAGPRESKRPGIYAESLALLRELFKA